MGGGSRTRYQTRLCGQHWNLFRNFPGASFQIANEFKKSSCESCDLDQVLRGKRIEEPSLRSVGSGVEGAAGYECFLWLFRAKHQDRGTCV